MKIEDIEHFFLETPLYEKFEFEETDGNILYNLIFFNGKLDSYCPSCQKESIFIGTNNPPSFGMGTPTSLKEMSTVGGKNYFLNKIHSIDLHCSRNRFHIMQQIVCLTDKQIFKIGQYPSVSEISQPELKQYRTVLSTDKYSELNRGVGLISHGVGIGAFVYLRRIFEDLIEEAHSNLRKKGIWDEEEYSKARMNEKIAILKDELPEFLVENKALYGILSKGIHELTEDECKEYFPTVKLGIELILDEKIETKKKQDKISNAKKSIAIINRELKDK